MMQGGIICFHNRIGVREGNDRFLIISGCFLGIP
jgi:hypothetical protein